MQANPTRFSHARTFTLAIPLVTWQVVLLSLEANQLTICTAFGGFT